MWNHDFVSSFHQNHALISRTSNLHHLCTEHRVYSIEQEKGLDILELLKWVFYNWDSFVWKPLLREPHLLTGGMLWFSPSNSELTFYIESLLNYGNHQFPARLEDFPLHLPPWQKFHHNSSDTQPRQVRSTHICCHCKYRWATHTSVEFSESGACGS